MTRVRLSREAAAELEEAARWYELQSPGLGGKLLDAVEQALDLMQDPTPPLLPMSGTAGARGAKRMILRRFPFSIVTVERNGEHIVVAFAHHARRPGYWQDRLPE